jgi:murein DD-endopeptidase MepM/ murein hydrolase activator NlpD
MPDAKIPAMAISDGTVIESSDVSKGGYIRIYFPQLNMSAEYMHLRRRRVKVGETVLAGEPIGLISYNPIDRPLSHLHFQLRPGRDGSPTDPEPYLAQWPVQINPYYRQLIILGTLGVAGWFGWQIYKRHRG